MPSSDDSYEDDSILGQGNHDTDQDEAIAQALQEEFQREVEQYASRRSDAARSAWMDIHSIFTPSTSRSNSNSNLNSTSDLNERNTAGVGSGVEGRFATRTGDENSNSSASSYDNNLNVRTFAPSSFSSRPSAPRSTPFTPSKSNISNKPTIHSTPDTSSTDASTPDVSFEYEDSQTVDLDAAFDAYTGPYDYDEVDTTYILDDLEGSQRRLSNSDGVVDSYGNVNSMNYAPGNNGNSIYVDDTSRDEALARRLQQEMRDEEMAADLAKLNAASASFALEGSPAIVIGTDPRLARGSTRNTNVTALDSLHSSSSDGFMDSPVARSASATSNPIRRSNSRSNNNRNSNNNNSSPSSTAQGICQTKLCYYSLRLLLALIVCALSFLIFLMVFGPKTNNESLDPASWLPGWPDSDPNLGSVGENNIWDMNGEYRGLTLQVLNNLESTSDWNEFFQAAISDWDNGDPDAVTLYVRQGGDYDPECRAIRKAMKVCNGNYGPTDWRGVNQILLQDEYIITSLAKMNDYYLEGTTKAQKQYTMCHEMGHGLGLGHTDENFHNRDLGNCMDYTERPQNNMHPDESNFETLVGLYGNVDGTSVRVAKDALPPDYEDDNNDGKRGLRDLEERVLEEEFEYYADFLSEPIEIAGRRNEEHPKSRHGWRMLQKSNLAEVHERDLGNGYSLRTTLMLA